MKTLDKYVAREMIVPFVAGFLIVLVLLVGNIVYNSVDIIVSKIRYWPDLLYYIFLRTPYFVMLASPAGALFGCSLAVSRLARDSELTMMRMAGISVRRVFVPVFVMGALISLVAYVFQEKVTVWAGAESNKVLKRLYLAPGGTEPVKANVFFRVENYYFYVQSVQRHGSRLDLANVMIYEQPATKGFPTLTTAKTASEIDRVWTLREGTTYRVGADGEPELVAHFKRSKLDVRQAITDYIMQDQKAPESMTLAELRDQMNVLSKAGQETNSLKLEFGYKLAIPLSSLVLMFCVAPLSLRFGRGGGFMGVLIGIIVLFFYWNVVVFSRVLGQTGAIPAALAGWSQVIIFSAAGAFLMWRVE